MNILTKIETLRSTKTPEEIEDLLLRGELDKIRTDDHSYQYIEGILLSHLVVEAHESGFIKNRSEDIVVHHEDADPLNNVFSNLRVMTRGKHARLHITDLRYAEAEKARCEAISAWNKDPANAEARKAINEAISKTKIAYYIDPSNAKANKARSNAISKAYRKNWINLKTLGELFTVKEFAEVSGVCIGTAYVRLVIIASEGKIDCKKKLIDGKWKNVYRRTET